MTNWRNFLTLKKFEDVAFPRDSEEFLINDKRYQSMKENLTEEEETIVKQAATTILG